MRMHRIVQMFIIRETYQSVEICKSKLNDLLEKRATILDCEDSSERCELQPLAKYSELYGNINIAIIISNALIHNSELILSKDLLLNIIDKNTDLTLYQYILSNTTLANIELYSGNILKAEAIYAKLMPLIEKISLENGEGLYSTILVGFLCNMASSKRMSGKLQEAVTLYSKALELVGSNKFGKTQIYNGLGVCELSLGNYDKSKKYLLSAIDLLEDDGLSIKFKRKFIGSVYDNLANCYDLLDEISMAKTCYEKAINYKLSIGIDDDISLARSYSNFSVFEEKYRNYANAKELSLKSLTIREKKLPKNHFDIGLSYGILASIENKLGNKSSENEYRTKMCEIFAFNKHNNPVKFNKGNLQSLINTTSWTSQGISGINEQKRNKTSRNDPCPCGSNKKYKKCCGA